MASPIVNRNVQCAHAHHLFAHPLCKKQSLAKRVAHVAFHILTLAIPLIIYRLTHRKVVKIDVELPKPDATVEKPKTAEAAPLPHVSVEPIEKPLTEEQKRQQALWTGHVNDFIHSDPGKPALVNHNFRMMLEQMHLLSRVYPLPLTAEQKQGLQNLPGKFPENDQPFFHWFVQEVLEIVDLPVPRSKEEQWTHSIMMIKRVHHHFEQYWESRLKNNPQLKWSQLRFDLEGVYVDLEKLRFSEWMRLYAQNYPEPQFPKGAVQVKMDASTVFFKDKGMVEEEEFETLPQVLIWDPLTNKVTAHFDYYLEGEGVKSLDLALDNMYSDEAVRYGGCLHYQSEEPDPQELQDAEAAGLPLVSKDPKPVRAGWEYPQGGLNFKVMVQMIEQLEAQGLNP